MNFAEQATDREQLGANAPPVGLQERDARNVKPNAGQVGGCVDCGPTAWRPGMPATAAEIELEHRRIVRAGKQQRRDAIALSALRGILVDENGPVGAAAIARRAYEIADAMLAESEKFLDPPVPAASSPTAK